jgi:hypothetical protein
MYSLFIVKEKMELCAVQKSSLYDFPRFTIGHSFMLFRNAANGVMYCVHGGLITAFATKNGASVLKQKNTTKRGEKTGRRHEVERGKST